MMKNHQHITAALTLLASTAIQAQLPPPPVSPAPVVNFEYDAEGHPTRTIRAPGVPGFDLKTVDTYDALARIKDHTDPKLGKTKFEYDGLGRQTKITDPRTLETLYKRNGLGDMTQEVSPDTGIANMAFDAAGNLKNRTDSRGVKAVYTYDALNRLTKVVYSQSGQANHTLALRYDEPGVNGIGRLTSTSHPAGSAAYSYDLHGRLLTETQNIKPAAGATAEKLVVSYGYDAGGRLVTIGYPSGRQLHIGYTEGEITSLGLARIEGAAATPLIAQVLYTAFGAVQSWQWQLAAGTQQNDKTYDLYGRIVRHRLGPVVRDLSYDAADRVTAYTHYDAVSGAPQTALNQSFVYDENGRLTGIATAGANWTLAYDASGNRSGVTLNGNARSYVTQAGSNRLGSLTNPARSFGYDAAGNTTQDSDGYIAGYDLAGRLASLTKAGLTSSYSYDGFGRRVRKLSSAGAGNTLLFVYDAAGQLLGEYDQNGKPVREYVWLGMTPIAMFAPDPAAAKPAKSAPLVYFIHADHINTPRLVTDRANKARWRWLANPFGTTAPETDPEGLGPLTFNLRFPGQYADVESGLNYNYFRNYDASIGRYTQSDPIGLAGGSMSPYAYSDNQPTSKIDPLGLATYMCTQPLHALGKAGEFLYAPNYTPLYHQYLGVLRPDGSVITGGQDRAAGPWGPGRPSDGDNAPGSGGECKKVEDDNDCIEECLIGKFAQPRPTYALLFGGVTNGGQNCQEWAYATLEQCRASCKARR